MSTRIETIHWQSAAEDGLPDADSNVLLYSEALGSFEGFLDGQDDDGQPVWRDVTAAQVHGITDWAEMPEGPQPALQLVGITDRRAA